VAADSPNESSKSMIMPLAERARFLSRDTRDHRSAGDIAMQQLIEQLSNQAQSDRSEDLAATVKAISQEFDRREVEIRSSRRKV